MVRAQQRVGVALARVPWIAGCGAEVVARLAADAVAQSVADGHAVAIRGRLVEHLVVVNCGTLEVAMTSPEGKRHVTSRAGPGRVFGLIPLLDGLPSIHDATARGQSDLVLLPRDSLSAAMQQFPALTHQVVRLLCSRARWSYDMLAAQALMGLPVRVARLLVSQVQGTGGTTLCVSQADLADMLGTTRQSLNAELQKMQRSGVIVLGRTATPWPVGGLTCNLRPPNDVLINTTQDASDGRAAKARRAGRPQVLLWPASCQLSGNETNVVYWP